MVLLTLRKLILTHKIEAMRINSLPKCCRQWVKNVSIYSMQSNNYFNLKINFLKKQNLNLADALADNLSLTSIEPFPWNYNSLFYANEAATITNDRLFFM